MQVQSALKVSEHNRFKAAVFTAPGRLELKEVTAEELGSGEVLVRVSGCGICGSDLNIFHRNPPIPKYWAGHEISGTVAGTGAGVEGLMVGDPVSVAPLIPCGKCEECRSGRENICKSCLFISFNLPGGFAEYVSAPKGNVYKLPEGVPLDQAVLIEPLADVMHAFDIAGGVEGKRVVVVGAGTIGLLTVASARALGAETIVATGKYAHQRELAVRLGANAAFTPGEDGFIEKAVAASEGHKADVVFETVGGYESESITQSIEVLRPGGTIVLSGVHYKTPQMNLKNLTEREIVLRGTQRYRTRDYAKAVELFSKGVIDTKPLVTHRVGLGEIMKGYNVAFEKDANRAVKVVVCP